MKGAAMKLWSVRRRSIVAVFAAGIAVVSLTSGLAQASPGTEHHRPGHGRPQMDPSDLLISRVVYQATPGLLTPGVTVLPPGCTTDCAVATTDGSYPQVWNNELADGNFGVTAPIYLDEMTASGQIVGSLAVPTAGAGRRHGSRDQLVGSFSSKSELALNLSPDGRHVTFMGYVAPIGALDVSNSNTPGVIDPTNPDRGSYYRAVASLDNAGRMQLTETNAFSGDNGRAAILDNSGPHPTIYAAGNAGNGTNPQPNGIITGTGAQILKPASGPESAQHPKAPTPVGSFSLTQLGLAADKVGKDTNFQALTIHDNVLHFVKGSGSNGVNTVYFLDTTGHACPNGVGLPAPRATLPQSGIAYDPAELQSEGVTPYNMCILAGFPTAPKSKSFFPASIWFANDNTVYLAQQGNGDTSYSADTGTYTSAAAQTSAGLQKWVRQDGAWRLAYTISAGLNLGVPYSVPGYPTGTNPATELPWTPATDGLRNITGRTNRDGSVTIWATTSTVSGNADPGADPNKLVAVTDRPQSTAPSGGQFSQIRAACSGEVLRGVSLTPSNKPRH